MKKIFLFCIWGILFFSFSPMLYAADTDNDGVLNAQDICPDTASGATVDQDGTTRGCSQVQKYSDSDGDSYVDLDDAFPDDATEWLDTDEDRIGNNTDDDDDNDSLSDTAETNTGWTVQIPIENLSLPQDYNFLTSTVYSDPLKKDTDGDLLFDNEEKVKGLNPNVKDTDGDGIRDNIDLEITFSNGRGSVDANGKYSPILVTQNVGNIDSDHDTVKDSEDICPGTPANKIVELDDIATKGCTDAQKILDTDKDSIPDYKDLDSDNDGLNDSVERSGWLIEIPLYIGGGEKYSFTGSSDIRLQDSDNDGLDDKQEKQKGLNPLDADTDRDGVRDDIDQEITSIEGRNFVDENGKYGASLRQNADDDKDGIINSEDICPGSAKGAEVYTSGSSKGCTTNQKAQSNIDADFDGVVDSKDACLNTIPAYRKNVDARGCVQTESFSNTFFMGGYIVNSANNLSIGGSIQGASSNVQANNKLQGFNENDQFIKAANGGEKGIYNTLIQIARDLKNLFYAIATIFFLIITLKLIFSGNTEEEVGNFKKGIIWITIGIIIMQIAYAFTQVVFDQGVSARLGASLLEIIVYPLLALLQTLASIFFIAMAFYAFYRMITANGNEEAVKTGKMTVVYALIGFVVIRFARAIVEAFYGHINCQSFSLGFMTVNGEQCINTMDISEGSSILIDILNWMNGFVAIAVLIMIIYAGVQILLSRGDEEKLKGAKNSLLYITIGIGILVMNYLILTFFLVPESPLTA